MRTWLTAGLVCVLCGASALAQQGVAGDAASQGTAKASAQTAAAGGSAQAAEATTVHAFLTKPVDARKSKIGDEVVAKSAEDVKAGGQVVVPRGSKLIGHVTQAQARVKGEADSMLGIAFDTAVLKDGREIPMALSIQAIAAPQASSMGSDNDSMIAGGGGPGLSGRANGGLLGGTGPVGAATNTVASAGGAVGGTARGASQGIGAGTALSASAHGAVGLPGVELSANSASSAQGSVISSKNQNVHLDSGTQLLLRVNAN